MTENPYESSTVPAERIVTETESRVAEAGGVAYGVVVRSLGLVNIVYGAWCVFTALAYAADVASEINEGDSRLLFTGGTFLMVVGMLLIGFASPIVRLSYPRRLP